MRCIRVGMCVWDVNVRFCVRFQCEILVACVMQISKSWVSYLYSMLNQTWDDTSSFWCSDSWPCFLILYVCACSIYYFKSLDIFSLLANIMLFLTGIFLNDLNIYTLSGCLKRSEASHTVWKSFCRDIEIRYIVLNLSS